MWATGAHGAAVFQLAVRAGVALLEALFQLAVRAGVALLAAAFQLAVRAGGAFRAAVFQLSVWAGGAHRAVPFHFAVKTPFPPQHGHPRSLTRHPSALNSSPTASRVVWEDPIVFRRLTDVFRRTKRFPRNVVKSDACRAALVAARWRRHSV